MVFAIERILRRSLVPAACAQQDWPLSLEPTCPEGEMRTRNFRVSAAVTMDDTMTPPEEIYARG